eukprot:2428345-Amphidinium_carterae.1
MPIAPSEIRPKSAIAWKEPCESKNATMVQSTPKWLSRWEIWDLPIGPSEIRPNSATTWKGHCA